RRPFLAAPVAQQGHRRGGPRGGVHRRRRVRRQPLGQEQEGPRARDQGGEAGRPGRPALHARQAGGDRRRRPLRHRRAVRGVDGAELRLPRRPRQRGRRGSEDDRVRAAGRPAGRRRRRVREVLMARPRAPWLALIALGAGAGCDWRAFDTVADTVPVVVVSAPDKFGAGSGDFGRYTLPISPPPGGHGARYLATAGLTGALAVVTLDGNGHANAQNISSTALDSLAAIPIVSMAEIPGTPGPQIL